jgi:N-acetyltransferase 10
VKGFTSHRKKRMKQLKKKIQKGTYDPNIEDPFELFVSSTRIRYCYYKETESILGQTFGMCILQDFEALTPSILCRTVETVQGGGIVCILLQTMNSLRQLYTVTMDIHRHLISKNKKSEAGQVDIQHRFNKRFILSIADCSNTLVVDDELNILPLSHRASEIVPIDRAPSATNLLNHVKINSKRETFVVEQDSGEEELILVKKNIEETLPAGPLVALTATLDQARVLMSVMDTIIEKKLNTTICITAARGRGKSATLGLAISSAIASSYSNIFVTAPSPENLGTVFEFVHKVLFDYIFLLLFYTRVIFNSIFSKPSTFLMTCHSSVISSDYAIIIKIHPILFYLLNKLLHREKSILLS